MTDITLSDELRRFIQTIESIPHLEAMLLLHKEPSQVWNEFEIAKRLYINTDIANSMLADLCAMKICITNSAGAGFIYSPSQHLSELIDQLALYYSCHLIQVTNMIHAKANNGRSARLFADAFKFKKED
jgi:hypothetical protein